MSRVIKTEGGASLRNKLMKSIALTLRELATRTNINDETRDMVAFICLCLSVIDSTIQDSVSAWEKRGYWVKADHFRLDWEWVSIKGNVLKEAILSEDWNEIRSILPYLINQCRQIKISSSMKKTALWQGSYKIMIQKK